MNIPFFGEVPLTLIIALAIILFAYSFFIKSMEDDNSFATHATSVLTSLGILGTFIGITIALYNFNSQDIQNSIPELLDGLKIAFISSIAGLSTAILFRYKKTKFDQKNDNSKEDLSAGDFHNQINQLTKEIAKGNKDIRDALVGEGDASLSTQIGKLRNDFRDFAEKVAEDGSQKLLEALENVIKDFNQKITEQFGENFKQLNEAVGALLVWQKEHKAQVEKLTSIFEETQKGIELANQSVKDIEQSTSKIPEQMQSIEKVFESTDLRMEELHQGLGTLADLRVKAEESLPILEKHLNSIGDGIKDSVEKQLNTMNDSFSAMEEGNTSIQENLSDLITAVSDSANMLIESAQGSQKELKIVTESIGVELNNTAKELNAVTESIGVELNKSAKELQTQHQATSNDLEAKMRESVETATSNINSLVEEVSGKMAEQVNKNVETLGQNLVAVSEALNQSYERPNQSVSKALKDLKK